MRSAQRSPLLAGLLLTISTSLFANPVLLRISESEMSAVISEKEITLSAAVSNLSATAVPGTLYVELIDPKDAVVASAKTTEILNPGHNVIKLSLPRPTLPVVPDSDPTLWYRVKYRLLSEEKQALSGMVALGAIAPDMFEVRIAHADKALPGQSYQVRVHAANPVTRKPVSGVEIRGELAFDTDGNRMDLAHTTNSSGDVVLPFQIPVTVTGGGSINIEARKRDQTRKEDFDFELDPRARVIINTDKLLYQPGQSLHARALVLSVDKHAVANADTEFKLVDPESNTVFSTTATTNDFGIANIDWELPDSTELGPYELQVSLSSDRYGNAQAMTNVRVSRYDLPNFTVAARPDRSYYLPGQPVSVAISAQYLFGKELTHGAVKLVREEQGHWDSTQHKWVVDQSDVQSGELDHSGRATFTLDLTKLQSELAGQRYRRFLDLGYAAYVTDPSTGKTEQRRFQLRLSQQPIHVYVSAANLSGDQASFYVSTYYPDGSPAECHINISEDRNHYRNYSEEHSAGIRDFLRTVKTNRFGVAKISGLQLLTEGDDPSQNHGYQLVFEVHDKTGAAVSYDEVFWSNSDSLIQVTTDKSLYQARDQITVSVRAPDAVRGSIIVDLSRDGAVLWTGRIGLHNHRGFTVIPYSPEFKGELTLAAYSLESDSEERYEIPSGARAILFPTPSILAVKVKTDRTTYKPGDDVSAVLNVNLPSGSSSATALGVVVVDKAVEERIRTDQEFGPGHYGFWDWSWWYPPESVGGMSFKDIVELDLSKPLPEGIDLVAEILLEGHMNSSVGLPEVEGNDYGNETRALFSAKMRGELEALRKAVLNEDAVDWKFATNTAELASVLGKAGLDPQRIVDPWGTPYHYNFGVDYRERTLDVVSAGPDKQLGTIDDVKALTVNWPYFQPVGKIIDRVVKETYVSSGAFIRDFDALNAAVLTRGLNLQTLRDPWGNPYTFSFEPSGSRYQVIVQSTGRNMPRGFYGPFAVWTSTIDYFEQARAKIDAAIYKLSRSTGKFPQDDETFDKAMIDSGVNFRELVDPWGHSYYVSYSVESLYGDTTKITYRPEATVQTGTPVTRQLAWIRVLSPGPDGQPNTPDDFPVASFSRDISEQSGKDLTPRSVDSEPLSGNTGAINGVVTDPSGAVVSNASVVATHRQTGEKFTGTTGPDGAYLIRNIPPGTYDVIISAPGFRPAEIRTVPVHSTSLTAVSVTLNIGSVSETVEVSGEALDTVETMSSSVAVSNSAEGTKVRVHEETFTPRLRDYFPETLFWSPSLITDGNGRARLKFKLADNITTWKMTVLASTKTGEIGVVDREIQAFQPFFLEHDPPKILTIGDLIDLPVVVRNYLPQTQQLNVEMKPANWFELQHPGKQDITVEAGESKIATFPFRATLMVTAGKQQVYGANHSTGDAVEKTITVHPDGQDQTSTVAGVLRGDSSLSLDIPTDLIPGSVRARLKIYPNLLAHVTESIEAGLERPYGCGEQTVSSTYPSVMLLKYYKASGTTNAPLQGRANRYAGLGYHRLLNYRESGGGFSYWGHGSPDAALTAYAVRFLSDVSAFTAVDRPVIDNAEKWLVAQQAKDGHWQPTYGYDDSALTAYIAVTLVESAEAAQGPLKNSVHESVSRALAYLSEPHRDLIEPYTLAEFAIATSKFGDRHRAADAISKLSKLATPEHGGMYWVLEHNTPFYGWGHAGRVESTAMVILALADVDPTDESRRLVDAGTLWLLQQKDRYGVWYSGQATVDVLSALLRGTDMQASRTTHARPAAAVNGRAVTIGNDWSGTSDAPAIVDISDLVHPGHNAIVVQNGSALSAASIQAVAEYYVPWNGTSATETMGLREPDALRLVVRFDRTEARVGEAIHCSIDAERIGSRGWGMMIAEIGLPPGADVDRRVLDEVVNNSGWTVSHYDVLPDRLVLYLWPNAGGTKLTFEFHPRYGLKARTAPSVLYDYYNPEALVALPPADFRINAIPQSEPGKAVAAK